ncbi:MAG: serine hydrolase [Bacteroidota bacterium]
MNKERILVALLLVITGGVGYFLGKNSSAIQVPSVNTTVEEVITHETRAGGYEFINPLVECDCFKPSKQVSTVLLEENLNNYISAAISGGKASHVSVYFRDLNNGPWIGINEKENFTPASLLKVPVMIAVLKKAEQDPLFLKKRLAIAPTAADDFQQNINDTGMVKPGKSYEVEDLVVRMIQHSDNRAATNLWDAVGERFMDRVFEDVQVKVTGIKTAKDYVSVKDYSTFFRLLYNASYLNREMSDKALRILTKSTFNTGLVAGLPKDMVIAHKFGERGIGKDGLEIVQLHDCGIIYAPQMPYLVCVMTRGRNFNDLNKVIADISAMVYRSVSGQ